MKRIAIYGEAINEKHFDFFRELFQKLKEYSFEYIVFEKYKDKVVEIVDLDPSTVTFRKASELVEHGIECLISIGGDGTMLNSFHYVLGTDIYVFGFNTGRLGFLSNVSTEQVDWALSELAADRFKGMNRAVLEINYEGAEKPHYAVNEVTIHKQDTSSMITIHTKVNEEFVNSYWADGIIVSTPTGSTAYSLSCGGPIVMPHSNNLMLTPIAPHNLNVRPLVFSDEMDIKLRVESRSDTFLLAMDSCSIALSVSQVVSVKKAAFYLKLLKLSDYNYFNTLRTKLNWGADKRN
jgi:NAD+ kinase